MVSIKIKYIINTISLFFVTTCASGQYDTIIKRMQQEFDNFKSGIEQEHRQFKSRNDSIFSAFLKDSWESFNVYFNPRPDNPKPRLQPVAPSSPVPRNRTDKTNPEDDSGTGMIIIPPDVLMRPGKTGEMPEFDKTGYAPVMVDFYGNISPIFITGGSIFVSTLKQKEINLFFDRTAPSLQVEKLLLQLTAIKKNRRLNDWGYLKLVEAVSGKLYDQPVEQTLISWVLLLKSGYNAKIGYTPEQVWLMVPSFQEMYNAWYLTIDEKVYYIVNSHGSRKSFPELTVHKANYPGAVPVSLIVTQLPETGNAQLRKEISFRGHKASIWINKDLIRFFDDYPLTRLGIYFSAPLSDDILQPLEELLNPLLKGSPLEKTTVLLEFVQKSFAYKTDREQFSREKFFFPDEIFWYPYADCEDRSVFFYQLVKHFTGLKCAGLEYPGHVTTAVLLPGKTSGSTITIDGQAYTVCDPTYRNAWPGFLAPEYQGLKPEIVTFE